VKRTVCVLVLTAAAPLVWRKSRKEWTRRTTSVVLRARGVIGKLIKP
jgi:hypothetical protein